MPLPPGLRNLRHAAACGALSLLALVPRPAIAADLPGARLEVVRGPGASGCPDSEQVSAEVAARLTPGPPPLAPLIFTVALDSDAEGYVAEIRVEGRRHGERTLRAAGPTCDALHDALIVTLLVLLDEDRSQGTAATGEATERTEPASGPPAVAAPPPPPPEASKNAGAPAVPAETAASPRRRPLPVSLWLSLGGAVTHGLPFGWSGAVLFDLSVRLDAFELSAGGFWGPSQRITADPGSIDVSVFGERIRGCYGLEPFAGSKLRVLGCATGALARLTGTGVDLADQHSVTRAWWMAGGAAEATLPLTDRIDAGLSVAVLGTLGHRAFNVEDSGTPKAYETPDIVAIVAARVEARLF